MMYFLRSKAKKKSKKKLCWLCHSKKHIDVQSQCVFFTLLKLLAAVLLPILMKRIKNALSFCFLLLLLLPLLLRFFFYSFWMRDTIMLMCIRIGNRFGGENKVSLILLFVRSDSFDSHTSKWYVVNTTEHTKKKSHK